MKKENLFSLTATDLAEAKRSLDAALPLSFQLHESDYHGGEYFRAEQDGLTLILQENFVEDDGEPTEAEFPEADWLLYVDGDEADVDRISDVLQQADVDVDVLRSVTY